MEMRNLADDADAPAAEAAVTAMPQKSDIK
jgi:hypothetical protein